IVFLVRKPPTVQAPGKDAIARISRQADAYLRQGRTALADRKFTEAQTQFEHALELDPANAEARHLYKIAVRAQEDEKTAAAAMVKIGIGDKKAFEGAIQLYVDDTTEGTPGHARLQDKLVSSLVGFGNSQCNQHAYADCAWALCRAWELAPPDGKPEM